MRLGLLGRVLSFLLLLILYQLPESELYIAAINQLYNTEHFE